MGAHFHCSFLFADLQGRRQIGGPQIGQIGHICTGIMPLVTEFLQ